MLKAIKGNKAFFTLDDIEKARDFFTALSAVVPFYTEDRDTIYEIKNVRNVSIMVQFEADIREIERRGKHEGVRVREWTEDAVSRRRHRQTSCEADSVLVQVVFRVEKD